MMPWRHRTNRATLAGGLTLALALGLACLADHAAGLRRSAAPLDPAAAAATEPHAALPAARLLVSGASQVTATPSSRSVTESTWLELDRYTTRPGESLSLRAGGFWPGEPVHVVLRREHRILAAVDVVAGPGGELTLPALAVPAADGGDATLGLEGRQSRRHITRQLAIVGFEPWIVLDEYSPVPGEAIGVRGDDFQPGEQVELWLDGDPQPIRIVQADASGHVEIAEAVRTGPADVGQHRLTVTASASQASLTADYEVLPLTPVMTLTTYAGPPGTTIRFNAHGFAPGETVRLYAERGQRRELIAAIQTDERGAFHEAGAWHIPLDWAAGTVALAAEGEISQASHRQTFTVIRPMPWVSVSSLNGGPGDARLWLRGGGFGANEPVDVLLESQRLASAMADDAGTLASVGPIELPSGQAGPLRLIVRGQGSGAEAETTAARR